MTSSTSANIEQTVQTRNSGPPNLSIYTDSESSETKTWSKPPTSPEFLNLVRTPLPFPPPLNREMFSTPDFNSDRFLANRRHLTLDELKKELNMHLKSLKSGLVEMINRDYASFVDLSTNLKGVDKVIEEVARPLGKMREEVQKINYLIGPPYEKRRYCNSMGVFPTASLQLLINIHESVRKVENLLLISSESASSLLSKDDSGNSAKQIERVAIEYNQMQYLVSKGKDLPFVANIDWRITRIKETLRTNLSSALRSALHSVKNQSNDASSKETLTQILRTYALIDQTKSAESVIRTELVAPSIHEIVSRPILENQTQPIPYTSAMSSTRPATKASKARYNLQYSKEPLALMYNRILTLINTDWFVLLEITRKILKGTSFEILVNSMWAEIVESITKKQSIIFNPGIPNVFHKNYTISMNFVSDIENMCTSRKSLLYLRNHTSYVDFMKRWQLPVYFQLRFKEISSQVENALITAIDIQVDSDNDLQSTLKLPASKSIIFAIERCWADDVFVYGLSHRFWKLTLQLIQRYKNWLLLGLTDLLSETHSQGNDKLDSPVLRPSNSPAGNNLAPVEAQEERLLKLLTIVAHDVENMTLKIKETYQEHIITRLPESMNDQPAIEESVSSSLTSMQSDLPDLNQKIATILTKRCTETLRQHIRSVITQFRGSNTKPPTEASYFVPHIIKPLITFCKVNKQLLSGKRQNECNSIVADAVALRYYNIVFEHLTTLKKTEESSKIMKRLKKGKSTRSSFFAGNSNGDGSDESGALMSDEDKIRLQILLDVKQFGKELTNIGLNPLEINGYTELYKVVEPYETIQRS
ncbi:Conserved oligomeric Golgi complex component [Gigaspora margarita]|uniref:Conserved oligomeric Golgi complex subunit 2 n=1 Tax=Gigaspora margarita TaxID=4874 RepID=A0A8H3X1L8_GIGMA|nr:Conserved oligomeric Golgi complex component [Gigaspora margarita]